MTAKITEGGVLMMLAMALCGGAIASLIKWNGGYSIALVTGFVIFAQKTIGAYFKSDSDDPMQSAIILLLSIGYCAMFGVSLWKWNEMVGGELIGGFALFLNKLSDEYFTGAEQGGSEGNIDKQMVKTVAKPLIIEGEKSDEK
jgi:hypothetical protein